MNYGFRRLQDTGLATSEVAEGSTVPFIDSKHRGGGLEVQTISQLPFPKSWIVGNHNSGNRGPKQSPVPQIPQAQASQSCKYPAACGVYRHFREGSSNVQLWASGKRSDWCVANVERCSEGFRTSLDIKENVLPPHRWVSWDFGDVPSLQWRGILAQVGTGRT